MPEEYVSAGGAAPAGGQERVHLFVVLAEAYRQEGLLQDAVRVLEEGLSRQPDVLRGRLLVADILLGLGMAREALAHVRCAERIAPGDPRVAELLERAHGGPAGLQLPAVADEPEPSVLFLDGREPGTTPPMASPMLAALYEAQGDPERAGEVRRALERGRREAEPSAQLEAWLEGLRDVRAAWLAARDGGLMAQATRPGAPEPAPAEWGLVLDEVRGLAEVLGWGEPRTLTLRRPTGALAWGFLAGGLAVGFEGGPDALPGQMRQRLRDAMRAAGAPGQCTEHRARPGGQRARWSRSARRDCRR